MDDTYLKRFVDIAIFPWVYQTPVTVFLPSSHQADVTRILVLSNA